MQTNIPIGRAIDFGATDSSQSKQVVNFVVSSVLALRAEWNCDLTSLWPETFLWHLTKANSCKFYNRSTDGLSRDFCFFYASDCGAVVRRNSKGCLSVLLQFPPEWKYLEEEKKIKTGNSISQQEGRLHFFFFWFFVGCNVLIESRWLQMPRPRACDDISLIF